jgi:hypothetical protein
MQAINTVIQFKARPAKATLKPWIGPIQAERERCLAVCLDPASLGHWGNLARTLLCETALSAEGIIDRLKSVRADVAAEIKADLAAGTFSKSKAAP